MYFFFALFFIALLLILPFLWSYIRTRLSRSAERYRGRRIRRIMDLDRRKSAALPQQEEDRIRRAYPDPHAQVPFPEHADEQQRAPEPLSAERALVQPSGGPQTNRRRQPACRYMRRGEYARGPGGMMPGESSPAGRRNEAAAVLLARINRYPPIQRGIIWAEILGPPRSGSDRLPLP